MMSMRSVTSERVGFQNSCHGLCLQISELAGGLHAACRSSLISPPRTLRRRTFVVVRPGMVAEGTVERGGRKFRAWCGR